MPLREGGAPLWLVGEGGFEPPTSCSQSRCPTELGHSPLLLGVTGMSLIMPEVVPPSVLLDTPWSSARRRTTEWTA